MEDQILIPATRAERRAAERRAEKLAGGLTECTFEELLFPVKVIENKMNTNSEYSKIVIGKIDGKNKALNYCSPRYELVPNKSIFPKINEILDAHKIKYDVTYFHIDNVRFYVDYVITDKRYIHTMKGTTDTIQPMLRVNHSYNGQTKYKIIFGYFRFICTNGLVIAVQEMKQYNLCLTGKHTKAIQESFEKLDVILNDFSEGAKKITKAITKRYDILGGHWVENVNDRIKEVLEFAGIRTVDNKNFDTILHIKSIVTSESNNPTLGYNGKINDFLIYNGINQYIHDNSRNVAAPEKRAEVDSKVFEHMLETA
jgi:hypothetical protein